MRKILPDVDGEQTVMCVGLASGLGRLFFGFISDRTKFDKILFQQVKF